MQVYPNNSGLASEEIAAMRRFGFEELQLKFMLEYCEERSVGPGPGDAEKRLGEKGRAIVAHKRAGCHYDL